MAERGVNKVILVARLGKDPEVRYMQSGQAVTNLSCVTSETYKDKSTGEQREISEWHSVVAFGKTAEIIAEYAKKGSMIYVEGKLKTRKWQDKDGNDRYSTEVHITPFGGQFQFLGGKSDSGGSNNKTQESSHNSPKQPTRQPAKNEPDASDIPFDDDIPF